jgi:hypothetical protein
MIRRETALIVVGELEELAAVAMAIDQLAAWRQVTLSRVYGTIIKRTVFEQLV